MAWLDLLQSGGIGGFLGGIGGVAEKLISTRMEISAKKAEYAHIEKMHELKAESEMAMAKQGLMETISAGEYTGLAESIKHDAQFKFLDIGGLANQSPKIAAGIYILQAIVNAIRALFRPFLTIVTLYIATQDPMFMAIASAATLWWVGSRGTASVLRKL